MWKFSVKKPFTILVMVIVMLILGVVSITRMQLDLLPEISLPYVIVVTTYPGASPEKVESTISEPMETALGTISGVENVFSYSYENYSMLELEFADGTDLDAALTKVYTKLDTVKSSFPEDVGTPSVLEISMDMVASLYLAVGYEGKDMEQLSRFVEDTVAPRIERQDGVASVTKTGLINKTVHVELTQEKVDALNEKIRNKANEALDEAEQKLADAEEELQNAEKELNDGIKAMKKGQKELDNAKAELETGKSDLASEQEKTYAELASATLALDQLSAYQAQLVSQQAQLTAMQTAVAEMEKAIAAAADQAREQARENADVSGNAAFADFNLPTTPEEWAEFLSGDNSEQVAQSAQLTQLLTAYSSYSSQIEALKLEIEVTKAIIAGYESKLKEMGISYTDIETAKLQAASAFGAAQAQIASGEAQLETAQATLDANKSQIDSGKEQLDSGWEQYNEALETFAREKVEALRKANANELLTLQTLSTIIYAQNFEMPAGYIDDEEDGSWLLKIGKNFNSLEELENLLLVDMDGIGKVTLGDVAEITIIDNSGVTYARTGTQQAVILSITKSSTAGTNEVSTTVREEIDEMLEEYPGLDIMVLLDQGDYINFIVKNMLQNMVLGGLLAVVILAIFLRDFLPTVVVAISIPLSVLTSLIAMYFTGISLNMMSLSGMALGVGMLVDNSIVVIENIYRLRGKGVSAPRAAVQGTRQVAGAITASTLTTVCVFFPMVYTTGLVRELMLPMALTIIFTLLASLLIAMTVVPASGSTLLRNTKPKEHKLFDKVQDLYGVILGFFLKVKIIPLAIAIGLLAFSIWQVVRMGVVIIPDMTAPQLQATLVFPEEMEREECYETSDEIISRLLEVDGVGTVGVMAGGSQSIITGRGGTSTAYHSYSYMINMEDQDASATEIRRAIEEMEAAVEDMPGEFSVDSAMAEMSSLLGSGTSIKIYGDDLDTLLAISADVMEMVDSVDGFIDITNGQEEAPDVLHLYVNRNEAMGLGLTVAQIYQEIATKLTTSASAITVTIDDVEMDVKIITGLEGLTAENIMDYEFSVSKTDENGNTVTEQHALGEFAEMVREDGFSSISRENQSRYITVSAGVEEGKNVTLLSRQLQPLLDAYETPDGYDVEMGGEYESTNEMIRQMALVFLLGGIFIYLVMVAQFQSLLSPFIVLFTVPLAFTGGLLALWFAGENLSIIALMGFLVLLGTVVNNGIVFVDYANQLRVGGLERHDALIATGKTRMRPILMTALTTILAECTLAFGDDLASEMGGGMALVIVGGMAYATLMTLFIVPVMYDILFKKPPLSVDVGSENLDDVPDDAAEYLQEQARKGETKKAPEKKPKKRRKKKIDDLLEDEDDFDENE
jgi:multidrug efflux pump subunit AcrB